MTFHTDREEETRGSGSNADEEEDADLLATDQELAQLLSQRPVEMLSTCCNTQADIAQSVH